METIKNLFDSSKDIYRTIEKVINYNVYQENRLKAEISEYVVTENIEEKLEKLLLKMQVAMEAGGENEVGVWVSGFYGSGKSSFTKYLGMAFDDHIQIDGMPFMNHLQNRLNKAQTKALLGTVVKKFPAAVIMLDLASEMLAGATMEEVSTVLYYKVLQWAGYSNNLKIASLERKMKKDGVYEEFKLKIKDRLGVEWKEVQNDPLVVDSVIPELAHEIYPQLFKTPNSFSTEMNEIIRFENSRVDEMLKIAREESGKEYIIFIIDEVGQYVGSRQNLILNLDGLAKNLKNLGDGKVWIIGTAQQTLTEDNPRTAINSPELYKLKDRFPIQLDLESSDIREICFRRLLGKSPYGEKLLSELFDKHGQELRQSTRLKDAKYYDSDFNKETFINLYPFLPAHFDILLHLLAALAKTTGGIGLRSAIKVIQDILIDNSDRKTPIADMEFGCIANTVILFDSLEKDIKHAFASLYKSVEKVLNQYSDSTIHQEVAKTVAILQILSNIPVNLRNVTSLMHKNAYSSSRIDEVEKAVGELILAPSIPFGEQDGNLCFFSEKLNDIEQERAKITPRTIEVRRIFNEAVKNIFSPLPSTRLNGVLSVTSGIKCVRGGVSTNLGGERETIQIVIELIDSYNYENKKTQIVDESRIPSSKYTIFVLGRTIPEIEENVSEISRCDEICTKYKNDPDQEVKKYCNGQIERALRIKKELQYYIKRCLSAGSFVFRGQSDAIDSINSDLNEACNKYLSAVAVQAYDRNLEAPVRVDTILAEKFLRTGDLAKITSEVDPLGLVQVNSGTPSIRTDHKALLSIKDFIEKNGNVEGKRLMENFSGAPFGWSQDTLRYLIAALLIGAEIKLRVSGREVTVNGQNAIDALKNNIAFKTVGIMWRDGRPSMDLLARAAARLTELAGEGVVPLEHEISKIASKYLPKYQARLAPLSEKLKSLELPGAEKICSLTKDIEDTLFIDASDAPQRFGGENSDLYENIKWATEVDNAFNQGLDETIKMIQYHRREINDFPQTGITGNLKEELSEEFKQLEDRLSKEDFYKHAPYLNTRLMNIQSIVNNTLICMADSIKNNIIVTIVELQKIYEWSEFTMQEQSEIIGQIENVDIEVSKNLKGLKKLINQQFILHEKISEMKNIILKKGKQRKVERIEEKKIKAGKEGETKYCNSIKIHPKLTSIAQIDELIAKLQEIKNNCYIYSEVDIKIDIGE